MRIDWGVFAHRITRDKQGFLTFHRIFQILTYPTLPTTVDCACAFGLRGTPGEPCDVIFRFFEPRGQRQPSRPTASSAQLTFGEAGFYEVSTDFSQIPLDVPGTYRFCAYNRSDDKILAKAQFQVVRA
jgi:hypothetical protein